MFAVGAEQGTRGDLHDTSCRLNLVMKGAFPPRRTQKSGEPVTSCRTVRLATEGKSPSVEML